MPNITHANHQQISPVHITVSFTQKMLGKDLYSAHKWWSSPCVIITTITLNDIYSVGYFL